MPLDKNAISKEAQKFVAKGQYDKAVAEWMKLAKETSDTRDLATIYNTIGDLWLKKDAKSEAADAYKRSADILADDGLDSKAIAVYKKILNLDPKRVDVHLALGDLNARKGLTGNALESYKVLADHYQKSKEMVKALGIYQKMADLNPTNTAFRTKLADMYAKEGMKKDAIAAYLAAATAHMGGDKFNEARQIFEKVLALDPNNKEVYHKAGIIYLKEGKFNEACKALKPVFEAAPENAEVTEVYLEALGKAGRNDDAVAVYEKLLEKDPSRSDLRAKLFDLYRSQQDYEKALAEAKKLADDQVRSLIETATSQGHKMLPGAVLPGAEQETDAERALKAFIEDHPDIADARFALSGYYEKVGRPREAAQQIAKVAGILIAKGDQTGAQETLSRALELWPEFEEARQQLDDLRKEAAPAAATPTAAAIPPAETEDPKVGEGLAEVEVLVKYGLTAKALEQLEALAKQFSDALRLRVRLRDLYREQNNAAKAVEHSLKAADICAQQGKEGEAEAFLREALTIDPAHAEVRARLGMTAPVEAEAPSMAIEAPPVLEAPIELPMPEKQAPAAPQAAEPAVSPEFGDALSFPEPFETAPPEPEPAAPEPAVEPSPEPVTPVAEMAPAPPEEAAPIESAAPARELGAEPTIGEVDISELWAEAEFYYQQGLFDEARRNYEKILEHQPDDARSKNRIKEISKQKDEVQEFADLAEAVEGLESIIPQDGGPVGGELAASKSDEMAVRSLMQDIQLMKQREVELAERERTERERKEQEARLKAEQEARLKAEQELRDLKERLNREAQLKAEQEARLKAEEELRKHKARELKAQEEDALRRAEDEIRERKERLARESQERISREERDRTERELRERRERERQRAAEEERKTAAPAESPLAAFEAATRKARAEDDFSDLNESFGGAPSPAAAPGAAGARSEDDFFDLAAELRDDLSSAPAPERAAGAAEEQSLDDIFEDFKKGVEQQETTQDTSSHYNLGIAYKEMGLLEDAIAEFLQTVEGETRFVESRYMLGLCFLEQGNYPEAVTEITNALNYAVSYGGTDEERISMLYDLGLAYQGLGNTEEAQTQFQLVFNMNPQYRDVALKLHESRAGETISMDQLKEDIEKEISSKVQEEGQRIEREEKTRRNDGVRS